MEKLVASANKGEGKDVLDEAMKFLENYVIHHFDAEEQIQIANSYPEYISHKQQHTEFLSSITEMKNEFETEGSNVVLLVKSIAAMGNWIDGHVKKRDKALAEYLRSRAKAGTLIEPVSIK